jgi:hypothetical protein
MLLSGMIALPLIVGGAVLAHQATTSNQPKQEAKQQINAEGYICPNNGEELPCRCCCPLEASK